MKVKVLVAHMNGYGPAFEKSVGDEYDIPEDHAGPLLEAALAEAVDQDAADAAPKGKGRGAKG